jgi:hypothetical protein
VMEWTPGQLADFEINRKIRACREALDSTPKTARPSPPS